MTFFDRFKKKSSQRVSSGGKGAGPQSYPKASQTQASPGNLPLDIPLLLHRSEKSLYAEKVGRYVFRIPIGLGKTYIADAIERAFGVHVRKVNIARLPSKVRRRGRTIGHKSGIRKAIVILAKGDRIDLGI